MAKGNKTKDKSQPSEQLKQKLKQNRSIQDAMLSAACATFCNENSPFSNPWAWIAAASVRRFYIRDRQFRSKWALSPGNVRLLQYIAAFACFVMLLVGVAPHKFSPVFPAWLLAFFGVGTSVLAQYVFIDFTLIQMSALVLISCHALTPAIAKGEEAVEKKLKTIRESFFPKAVSRSAYLLISFGISLFIPFFFPIGGYTCIMFGVWCSEILQVAFIAANIAFLVSATLLFALPVARFTNEDVKSVWLNKFIRRNALLMDPLSELPPVETDKKTD